MPDIHFGSLWAATAGIVRREQALLVPVAGLFLFVPQLLVNRILGDATPDQLLHGNPLLLVPLLAGLVVMTLVGQTAIVALVLGSADGRGLSVRGALGTAIALLPAALALTLIQGLVVFAGTMLLILPGLYAMARLVVALPALIAGSGDALAALRQSWRLTEGHGFRILGMLLLLIAGFLVLTVAISGLGHAAGIVGAAAGGSWGLARWLVELVGVGASTAISVYYFAFVAILYQALAVR
jgi:hypothetical protein